MARTIPETMNVSITMTPAVFAIFQDTKQRIDAMTPVVSASVRLFDCLCEFEGDPGPCREKVQEWDTAVDAYKAYVGR